MWKSLKCLKNDESISKMFFFSEILDWMLKENVLAYCLCIIVG